MSYRAYSAPIAAAGLFLRGLGQGATGIPSIAAAYAAVPKSKLSLATTALNIVQRLGGPILTTALAAVVSLSVRPGAMPTARSFEMPFLALLVLQGLVLLLAIQLPARIVHAEN
jgi:hypothetical protein